MPICTPLAPKAIAAAMLIVAQKKSRQIKKAMAYTALVLDGDASGYAGDPAAVARAM